MRKFSVSSGIRDSQGEISTQRIRYLDLKVVLSSFIDILFQDSHFRLEFIFMIIDEYHPFRYRYFLLIEDRDLQDACWQLAGRDRTSAHKIFFQIDLRLIDEVLMHMGNDRKMLIPGSAFRGPGSRE